MKAVVILFSFIYDFEFEIIYDLDSITQIFRCNIKGLMLATAC